MNKEQTKNPLDSNYENIVGKLSACQKVIEMMETDGWKDIVGPRINNMINEYSGTTKPNGLRSKGIAVTSYDEKALGMLSGMIEVYNMIVSHGAHYEGYKERMEGMEKRATQEPSDYMGAYE